MQYSPIILALSLLISYGAYAQGIATFTYQRSTLHIHRTHPPTLPNFPWQQEDSPRQTANPSLEINVDIRPSESLYRQEGWINMGSLTGLNAMMFIFNPSQSAHVGALDYYQPLDVLWVDDNGNITSIAPSLQLAEIREPLVDNKPSKAIILLPGGTVDAQSITPGDTIIDSDFFQTPPKILTIQ